MKDKIIEITESDKIYPKKSYYKYEIEGILHDTKYPNEAFVPTNPESLIEYIEGNYDYTAKVVEIELTKQELGVEEYFVKRYGKPEDKFYMSEKSFDYYDMVDFAEQYAECKGNEWISVEEDLPDDVRDVLVYTDKKACYVTFYHDGWCLIEVPYIEERDITYWRELPNPPKTEKP